MSEHTQLASTIEESPASEGPGTVIGPYKLLQTLGEGGMGVVYLAEQQHPVARRVALKIIKPGMDSAQVIARFEAERQALAMMDHHNIARVLDAGTTRGGRPYFVMELVKGIPINTYCDQEHLTPRQRLELFIPVCQAVQHAHQKGIIHRDLKPTNVLIANYDGQPVPKVIDFGVAKATNQRLTEKTLFTQVGSIVGTLEYMAPEQAEVNNLDVDTRADIYSLGVICYELLAGSPPFSPHELRSATFDEMLRIIREVEPPKPSTKLSSSDELPSIAASRKLEPSRLTRLVAGELDWIVMKCLEKDRGRRYQTASALAADIERYLTNEPVLASPPSVAYRLRKFAWRHRVAVLATSLVMLALVIGLGGITWGLIDAIKSEARATEQAQLADEARGVAQQRYEDGRRHLYAARASLLQLAWRDKMVRRVQQLLDLQKPDKDESDLRGFEWHYYRRLVDGMQMPLAGHSREVVSVAFSRDGRMLASGSLDGTARVWELATGQELRSLEGHGSGVVGVVFSFGGEHLATIGDEGEIKVWLVQSGRALYELRGSSGPATVAFSKDGQRLAIAGEGRVTLHDAATGEETAAFPVHGKRVTCLAFSPDGSRVASVGEDQSVRLWEIEGGKEVHSQRGLQSRIVQMRFNTAGQDLLLTTENGDLIHWQTAARKFVPIYRGSKSGPLPTAMSGDGKRLALLSPVETVRVFDTATNIEAFALRGHTAPIRCIAFSPDDTCIATAAADGTLRVWSTDFSTDVATLPGHQGQVNGVAFSPDGRRLASVSVDGTLRIREADTGETLLVIAAHAARGRRAASSDDHTTQNAVGAMTVAWHRDGQRLATAGADGSICLWDAATGKRLQTLQGHTDAVMSIAFSSNGNLLASASWDKSARIWDVETALQFQLLSGHTKQVGGVAFRSDDKLLATGSWDRQVKLWDVASGREIVNLPGHVRVVESVCFSPDGTRVAGASNAFDVSGEVKVWEIASKQEVLSLKGHLYGIYQVCFSNDGQRLYTASCEGAAKIWDATTGQELFTFHPRPERSNAEALHGLALSPDGRRLALACRNASVVVLDASEPTAETRLRREALRQVQESFDRLVSQSAVKEHLQTAAVSEPLRQQALAVAERFRRDPEDLNRQCWEVVNKPDANSAEYERALLQGREAHRLAGEDGRILNTLGAALYRNGLLSEAVDVLTRADKLNTASYKGPVPADQAFLAMVHHRLNQTEQAQAALDRLRAAMKKPTWAKDPEAIQLHQETEVLVKTAEQE